MDNVIDVVEFAPALLDRDDSRIQQAVSIVSASNLAVVASPTFKASYSGLLKLFLDQFATADGLRGVTAVPLMLGAGAAHALAPELLLRPVLTELGASVPAPGLYLPEHENQWEPLIQAYSTRWIEHLRPANVHRTNN
ncbi:putative flavoprotein [Rhodococcus triatomae BKS 15-14]|nr:putative flavoprotein [Rhodococcus triatomae BKS 15-14]